MPIIEHDNGVTTGGDVVQLAVAGTCPQPGLDALASSCTSASTAVNTEISLRAHLEPGRLTHCLTEVID